MRLTRARARVERAMLHQKAFGDVWNAFLQSDEFDPYEVFVSTQPDGTGSIYVDPSYDFPRDELALEFGEFLYQLRAALDSMIYELAVAVHGQDPPPGAKSLEFPICSSRDHFERSQYKIAPLTDQHREMIAGVQPYRADFGSEGMAVTARTLEELNDLARKDRHRGLRVVASWGANKSPRFDLPPGCSLEYVNTTEDGLIENDGEIATYKIRGWRPGMTLMATPNFTIDVTVEDARPPIDDEDTLANRTRTWLAVITVMIEGLEETFAE